MHPGGMSTCVGQTTSPPWRHAGPGRPESVWTTRHRPVRVCVQQDGRHPSIERPRRCRARRTSVDHPSGARPRRRRSVEYSPGAGTSPAGHADADDAPHGRPSAIEPHAPRRTEYESSPSLTDEWEPHQHITEQATGVRISVSSAPLPARSRSDTRYRRGTPPGRTRSAAGGPPSTPGHRAVGRQG